MKPLISPLFVYAKPQPLSIVYFTRQLREGEREGPTFPMRVDLYRRPIIKIKQLIADLFSVSLKSMIERTKPSPLLMFPRPTPGFFSYHGPAEGMAEALRKHDGFLLYDEPKSHNPFAPWRRYGTGR